MYRSNFLECSLCFSVSLSRIALSVCAAMILAVASVHAQPVLLGIQTSNNAANVSWPSGLNLVQPQKSTNLSSSGWQDHGAATTGTNFTEVLFGQAYFRLRFLGPNITAHPQGQTNATGSNVVFNVTATGTAPFAYQWRKEGTNLAGKTATSLSLSNLVSGDAGNYTVLVSNRVAAVTSLVAVLGVTSAPVRPVGIYMGTFGGQADNG